jgi:hypothetical protein
VRSEIECSYQFMESGEYRGIKKINPGIRRNRETGEKGG